MVNIDDIKKRAKRGKTDACLQLLQYYAQGSNGVQKDTFEAKSGVNVPYLHGASKTDNKLTCKTTKTP